MAGMSEANNPICIHAHVSGRVQGVWFRAFTRERALEAGVTGWAKNLSDGRVEVMRCGEEAAVEQVLAAIHEGPPNASVSHVDYRREERWGDYDDFSIA